MICVECGKEGKTYEGLCLDCYLKKKKLIDIPSKITITFCRNCDSYRIEKTWKRGNFFEDLKRYIDSKIRADVNYKLDFDGKRVRCVGFFEGRKIQEEKEIEIIKKYRLCDKCALKRGGYYEAILQIRGTKDYKEIEKIIKRKIKEKETFISKKEIVRGGIDYYIGNKKAAMAAVKEIKEKFGGDVNISSSLVGLKEGKRIYRDTYSIRFPEYSIGDFLKIDEKVYRIVAIGKKLELEDFEGERKHFYKDELKKAIKLEMEKRDAMVLHEDDKGLYIMDTKTYKTFFINKPRNWKNGKKLKIVEYEGKVYGICE